MSWLNGASDLATVVKSIYGGGSAVAKQDWASLGANLATAAGKAAIYASKQNAVLAKALKDAGTKVLPTPTAIVDAAAIAILVVDFLNGFGTPNSGAAVTTAGDKLDLFIKDLDPGCVPNPADWSGSAATAYTAQNAALKAYAQAMKDLDKQFKSYLKSQADEVNRAHMNITVNSAVLTAAQGIALALYLIPIVGPEVSCAWQIIAAFACCSAVLVIEMLTLSNSMSLSGQITALGAQYVKLGQDVETALAGTFGQIRGKVAEETSSQVSTFASISGGLSSFVAAPSVASLATKAGEATSAAQQVLISASAEKDTTGKSPAGTSSKTPTDKTGTTPASFTPPSVAQIGQASQQLNTLSQTVNQGMQQIAQLAQSAKGQGAPAAAQEVSDVKDAPDDEAAARDAEDGAASGTDGGGRAPIGAAASGAQPAAPHQERVL